MKKILALMIAAALALSLAACSGGDSLSGQSIAGSLEEMMNRIVETADVDSETREYILGRLAFTELTPEDTAYYLGKEGYAYQEGYAAEPMVNAQAFSLVLLRAGSAAEAEALRDEIKKTADPRKWICVGVEESDVQTASVGDVVLLVMAEDSGKYISAFQALAE